MISFRLDLAKQLITGFSQRKTKQRSQQDLNHPVAREYVSIHVEGRGNAYNASKLGKEHQKTCFECSLCTVTLSTCHNDYHIQAY